MRVRFKKPLRGDYGRVGRGDERDVDARIGKDLVSRGLAEEIKDTSRPARANAGRVNKAKAVIGKSKAAAKRKPAPKSAS